MGNSPSFLLAKPSQPNEDLLWGASHRTLTQHIRNLGAEHLANKILDPEVAKCRIEFPDDSKFLSDWQVYSANLVQSAILAKADEGPYDAGPRYLPFPTGSGKTIGARWGITKVAKDYPDKRICFLTPYQTAVDQVHLELLKHLGPDVVGKYHGEAFVDKEEELAKQVVVLTHKFVQYNKGALDDRDIFIIDEAIYATAQVSLKLTDFSAALDWATSQGVLTAEFAKANKFANDMYGALNQDDTTRFFAAPKVSDRSWAKAISDLNLTGKIGQTISQKEDLAGVKIFCEALLLGLVFLDRGKFNNQKKYEPTFNAAILGIPKLENTIILTATGGLIYDIAGTIKESQYSKQYAVPATYENVTLVALPDPNIKEQYKTWTTPTIRNTVTNYLDWLLKEVKETEVYVSMPLAVYKSCLRMYFGLGKGELELPKTVTKHGKTLHLSHHQLSIGTNQFKDCLTVIYLWPNHLPKKAILQEKTALEGKQVTDDELLLPNTRTKHGPFNRMIDAKYVDNIIQQIGRGNIRQITGIGKAGTMTAYLLVRPDDMSYLKILMSSAKLSSLQGNGVIKKPTGRLARLSDYLNYKKGDDVGIADAVTATGIEAKYIKETAQNSEWVIEEIGYQFQEGARGRGKSASFKWIG
jgi:hypothetical protein